MANIKQIKKKVKALNTKVKEFDGIDALLKSMDKHAAENPPDETYYNNVKGTRNRLLSEINLMLP